MSLAAVGIVYGIAIIGAITLTIVWRHYTYKDFDPPTSPYLNDGPFGCD